MEENHACAVARTAVFSADAWPGNSGARPSGEKGDVAPAIQRPTAADATATTASSDNYFIEYCRRAACICANVFW